MGSVFPWLVAFAIPVLLIAASSFVKISIVLGILRNAFGGSDIPPATVLYALAAVLTAVVMAPVVSQMAIASGVDSYASLVKMSGAKDSQQAFVTIIERAEPPLKHFLNSNAGNKEKELFTSLRRERAKTVPTQSIKISEEKKDDFWIVLPAFLVTELREAFQIGIVLWIPFLVIDAVVHIGLIALGIQSMNAVTLTLPIKLMVFLAADGWNLLAKALISGYG